MRAPDAHGAVPHGNSFIPASGPTESPWLKILSACLKWSGAVLALSAIAGLIAGGPATLLSVLFGGGVVMLFFGISLAVGHAMGEKNPSGAIGAFIGVYVVKVVGFGGVMLALGAPPWLDRTWFFGAAVATVLVWQFAEVVAFSRLRLQLFSEGTNPATPIAGEEDARG